MTNFYKVMEQTYNSGRTVEDLESDFLTPVFWDVTMSICYAEHKQQDDITKEEFCATLKRALNLYDFEAFIDAHKTIADNETLIDDSTPKQMELAMSQIENICNMRYSPFHIVNREAINDFYYATECKKLLAMAENIEE